MARRRLQVENIAVQCPCCWEDIELEVDASGGSQTYTEDCSVCCNPMLVRVQVDEDSGAIQVDVDAENG